MKEGLTYVETWYMSEKSYRSLCNCLHVMFLDNVRNIIEDLEYPTNFNYLNGGH